MNTSLLRLSTGDIQAICGIPPTTLADWCNAGLICPKQEGKGSGRHREFTVIQAVAIAYGLKWKDWGAGWQLIVPIVQWMASFTEEKLLEEFSAGRTHLQSVPDDMALMKPANGAWEMFDVQRVYQDVKRRIEDLARKPKNTIGRSRGLAMH